MLARRSLPYLPSSRFGRRQSLRWIANGSSNAPDLHSLFNYTSGRWLRDERTRLEERHVKFNVDGLKEVVIACRPGAKSVLKLEKLGEGTFNKAILATLDDGQEVVARIRHPNAGPPRLETASEVATMEYVRRLGIPVPEVFSWSCSAEENPVGTEYMIMSKAKGINLGEVWFNLGDSQKRSLVDAVVKMETKLAAAPFAGIGSLFFHDIRGDGWNKRLLHPYREIDDTFVLGPTIRASFWDGERQNMDIDRGPWSTAEQYLHAAADAQYKWTEQYAKPVISERAYAVIGDARNPVNHLKLIERFKTVIDCLVPHHKPELIRSVLWHHDLGPQNIFIEPTALDSGRIEITSIIDWQGVLVEPLLMAARIPPWPWNHEPSTTRSGLAYVKLPDGFDDLPEDERIEIRKRVASTNLQKYYQNRTYSSNTQALDWELWPLINTAMRIRSWPEAFLPLRDSLIKLQHNWHHITWSKTPCPLDFSRKEVEAHIEEVEAEEVASSRMDSILANVGAHGDEGWVHPDDYEEAVLRNEALHHMFLSESPTEEEKKEFEAFWPFPFLQECLSPIETDGLFLKSPARSTPLDRHS